MPEQFTHRYQQLTFEDQAEADEWRVFRNAIGSDYLENPYADDDSDDDFEEPDSPDELSQDEFTPYELQRLRVEARELEAMNDDDDMASE